MRTSLLRKIAKKRKTPDLVSYFIGTVILGGLAALVIFIVLLALIAEYLN